MTSLTIQLPDELAAEAKQAGLLDSVILSAMISDMLLQHRKEVEQQSAEVLDLSRISISTFSDIQDPVAWQREIRDAW